MILQKKRTHWLVGVLIYVAIKISLSTYHQAIAMGSWRNFSLVQISRKCSVTHCGNQDSFSLIKEFGQHGASRVFDRRGWAVSTPSSTLLTLILRQRVSLYLTPKLEPFAGRNSSGSLGIMISTEGDPQMEIVATTTADQLPLPPLALPPLSKKARKQRFSVGSAVQPTASF